LRAAKVDNSQRELVPFLEAHGATFQSMATVGKGCPDGVVGFLGVDWLVEFKTGAAPKAPSKRKAGRTEAAQAKWHAEWRGASVAILRTRDDAEKLLERMRFKARLLGAWTS
jgi:hypothetical protein